MSVLRAVSICAAVCLLASPRLASQSIRVVDSATSRPIERAEILVAGYATVRTSEAGVVSLRFLKPGTYQLIVRRVGYTSKTLTVEASKADTSVMTTVLAPIVQSLPTVTTEAPRSHKLEMMGFYERQKSSAAPRSAFVTAEDIERWKPMLLSDVRYKTGRSLDRCDTYLDGVRIADPASGGRAFRRGIDGLVRPSEVAAMEVYRMVEAPARFTSTASRAQCVLLIWLK